MPNERIYLVIPDATLAGSLERSILRPAGYETRLFESRPAALAGVQADPPDLLIVGEALNDSGLAELAAPLQERYPALPVILLGARAFDGAALQAMRLGFADFLAPPLRSSDLLNAVRKALARRQRLDEWARAETRRNTTSLQRRLDGLEAMQRIGRTVTSMLDLDKVLSAVVDAAVELTGAEEGSLLLLDEATGELYMRAARNFGEEFVHTFRLPVSDSLPGQVLRSGRPLLMDARTPQKVKTAYLVHNLMYAPLIIRNRAIGVLGVDNRSAQAAFTDFHLSLVAGLADYAAVAVENAGLFARTEIERERLGSILNGVQDGVIVVDLDGRLALVNHSARQDFGLGNEPVAGRRCEDLFPAGDLLELLQAEAQPTPTRTELPLEDGRTLHVQVTPIEGVGRVITMQDITHLKELDRIKSDFVQTVSHDLRSPLTAILGYVELLDRVGPINPQQADFIRRVQLNVHNITALINDLLDLGRIEAGFDTRKEIVPLAALLHYTVETYKGRAGDKGQTLIMDVPDDLPPVLGNSVRLRQMVANLLGNAVKYTPVGGDVAIRARAEGDQAVIQVSDNGPGIPPADQPYVFDKFYRASNVGAETPGTGLGLSIVKSIVEAHAGRIWLESTVGKGTIFTVVLPLTAQEL
jgi:two-component system NtrC family sensor kinase